MNKDKIVKKPTVKWREPRTGEERNKLWLKRIDDTLQYRADHPNGDEVWKRMYRLFAGHHWDEVINNSDLSSDYPRSRITVNRCMSTVRDTLAFIMQSNPKFIAEPKRVEDVFSAKVQGAWINTLWEELEIDLPVMEALLDALIIGMGVVKTGFTYQSKDDVVKSVKMDGSIQYNDFIQKEKPYVYRVNPRQFIWDFSNANILERSRWCAEIIFKPIEDVFANKFYNQKLLDMIDCGDVSPMMVETYSREPINMFNSHIDEYYRKDNERFAIYEIFDKKYMEHIGYIAGCPDEPLFVQPWPYDYLIEDGEGFPYEVLKFVDMPNEPFGQGILQSIEDQQHELNRSRTRNVLHARKVNRKYVIRTNSLTIDQKKALAMGVDGTIIEANDPSDIQAIPDLPTSPDQYNNESTIVNDIRELTGNDALISGGGLPSRTSASEINARTGIKSTKLGLPVSKVDKFNINIALKILSHSRANITTQEAVRILGSQGQTWEEFTKTNLSSRITLKLEYSSSQPYNKDIDKQQRMNLFQMTTQIIPLFQQSGIQMNIVELFKWVLEPFEFKDITRIFPEASVIMPTLPFSYPSLQKTGNQNMPNPTSTPNFNQSFKTGASGNVNSQLFGGLNGGSNNNTPQNQEF